MWLSNRQKESYPKMDMCTRQKKVKGLECNYDFLPKAPNVSPQKCNLFFIHKGETLVFFLPLQKGHMSVRSENPGVH